MSPLNGGVRVDPARTRLGNLWVDRDQEFSFGDGRLVLRGVDDPGASEALEVLFPAADSDAPALTGPTELFAVTDIGAQLGSTTADTSEMHYAGAGSANTRTQSAEALSPPTGTAATTDIEAHDELWPTEAPWVPHAAIKHDILRSGAYGALFPITGSDGSCAATTDYAAPGSAAPVSSAAPDKRYSATAADIRGARCSDGSPAPNSTAIEGIQR